MKVGLWLHELGLGQYEALFLDNAVDFEVLPELTEADLQQLGIPLGHRKRLVKAIRRLTETPPANQSSLASPPTAAPASPLPGRSEAERRPMTVMICDLVGSTSMAAKLDAEDWRELVNAYLDNASKAVTQYGGHVLKKLGDGLLALFGYPMARENDAEHAVRAGLTVLLALNDLNASNAARGLPALVARIGLESGPVVVDHTGEVFGDPPNVAARVQSVADPGTLVVTEAVQRQVAGLFVAEDKGLHELKGVPGRTRLYRLTHASGGRRRVEARALTALVGREDELALLARRWRRVKGGEGQFLQIVGEPGIGKSRLVEEFRTRIGGSPHSWIEWSASQLLQNTPLHPLAEWGRQRFGGAEVAAEKRLAEVEQALALAKLDVAELAPLLAPLLDIPKPEAQASRLAPEELRRRQLAALVAWILAVARQQPAVLAFEDLHWADPTSLDLMKAIADRGAQAPLLIVATTRPEFRAPWATRSHHGVISLVPLDRMQIRQMIASIAERRELPPEVVEGVSERTGGVPFFVEEVTRLVIEGGAQTIPPTLQQSLAARLDRLGDAREIAQIGAVLGREFSYALLTSVADLRTERLDAALEKLADADLLFVEGTAPAAFYRFKHALIQDAAYESLLKSDRQTLHRRAAEALVASKSPQPELVAHHFTRSNQTAPAIEWWGDAGDAALRRSAFQEATSHLGKAIEMVDASTVREPDANAGVRAPLLNTRAKLQVSLAQALLWTKGWQAQETTAAFARAVMLADQTESAADRCAGYYGVWVGALARGEPERAHEMAERFAQEIEARPGSPEAMVGHRVLGVAHFRAGDFVSAARHLRQALQIYDPERHRDLANRFGQDPGPSARIFLALSLWVMGEIDEALSHADLALTEAHSSENPPTIVFVLTHKLLLGLMGRDRDAVAAEGRRLVDLVAQHDLPTWSSACAVFYRGWVNWRSGEREIAIAEMREGIEGLRDQRHVLFVPFFEPNLAEAEAGEAGLERLNEALAETGGTGHRYYEAETHRIRGELMLRRDPMNVAPAEDAFHEAIAVARRQGARSFELRAALALALLHQSTSRLDLARAALGAALREFAPARSFLEIEQARALLAAKV